MEMMTNDRQGAAAPEARPGRSRLWSGRLVAAVLALALIGAGAAIGVAMTGGASAATGAAAPHAPAGRHCAKLTERLRPDRPVAARRVTAFCHSPLLRLAAVGGAHGRVTFEGKDGTRTIAFERGTIESVSATAMTVRAADGTIWNWSLAGGAIVREAGHRVSPGRLVLGDEIFVGGEVVSGGNDARLIRIRASA